MFSVNRRNLLAQVLTVAIAQPLSIATAQPSQNTDKTMSFLNRKLHVNGLAFNVRDIGVKEPALVLIHYMGGAGRTWDLVAGRLSERHRCVAPDLRGWGGSDKSLTDYDLNTQADDIAAIIRSLGISQYVLVGQSMGGKIAQILGARRPPGLKGLVLVAPAPPTPMEVPQEQKDAYLKSYLSAEGLDTALSVLTHRQLSPELRQQVVDDTLGARSQQNALGSTKACRSTSEI